MFLEENDKNYDPQYDGLYTQAEMLWINVRGDRYSVHEIPHLYDLLIPHDEILKELFGVSTKEFVEGIGRMQFALTHGLGETLKDMVSQ